MLIRKSLHFWVISVIALTCATFLAISNFSQEKGETGFEKKNLVVHEWGTFTSVLDEQGMPISWRPLDGPTDLPKFVSIQKYFGKGSVFGTVRMETPVLYFYTRQETSISVKVDFPSGNLTEWYPHALNTRTGLEWKQVALLPTSKAEFPTEAEPSHYYAARETDASPVRVLKDSQPELEKFLFYRGVGTFDLPISARLVGTQVVVKNTGQQPISKVILFENRGGTSGYSIQDLSGGEATLERPVLGQSLNTFQAELEQQLIQANLYEKEAKAMVKTWKDQWSEEGLRLFYLVPQTKTDEVLPLKIIPRPSQVVRVLVGRAELITPEVRKSLETEALKLTSSSPEVRSQAVDAIKKHGRFAGAFLLHIARQIPDKQVQVKIYELIRPY